jgi:hypothetical protein
MNGSEAGLSSGAKAPARDAVVEKTMRQQLTERRVIEGQAGHVRVRWPLRIADIIRNPLRRERGLELRD